MSQETVSKINVPALDEWTPIHFGSGVLLATLGVNRVIAYGLIALVEILELILRNLGVKFFRESTRNVVADIAAGVAGYESVRALT